MATLGCKFSYIGETLKQKAQYRRASDNPEGSPDLIYQIVDPVETMKLR